VLAHAPHDNKTILNGNAQGYQGSTPYVRWGNWPFIIFCLCVIAFVISRKKQ
jgi:apolipoprotein N-acyltransferase